MFGSKLTLLSVAAGLASVTVAQLSGWEANQVNTTMCMWQQLRGAVIRDTVYLDGGFIYWRPGLIDGSYDVAVLDENSPGIVLTLNFSVPFNMSQNISALFGEQHKAGSGSANNIAPLYYDGAMLANDDEYFLFGGLIVTTDASVDPDDDEGLEWQEYDYGVDKPAFAPGFKNYKLDDDMTRYIAYGGASNVPSENLAFYFSGMHSDIWGEISYPGGNESLTATVVSDTLITLDLSTQNSETWNNVTLPDSIPGRANPELIWVPVGEKGILVALGGVVYPEFINADHVSDNATASAAESPDFMTNINIYDISNGTWYTQTTTGGPGALTRGCTVVQPAKDYSSFNIYWYGGYDGLHYGVDTYFSDDVWILSLPSFTWKQVFSGRSGYGRAGHKCFMPYPDQMMVIGGFPAQGGEGGVCLSQVIELFNVSSAQWLDSYDPAVWSEYSVPSVIYDAIGGDASGTATVTAPSSWNTSALANVFQTAYATSKITTYYPYHEASTTSSPGLATYTPSVKSNSGVPKYLPPLLGVLLGLIFLSSVIVGILLWRRRRLLKKNGGVSIVQTDENGNRIVSWLNGQRIEKASTVTDTTEDITHPTSPEPEIAGLHYTQQYPFPHYYDQQQQQQQQQQQPYIVPYEMDNTEVVELPDNSRAELSETSMSPSEIVDRHTRFGTTSPVGGNRSLFSSIAATDHASIVSSNSAAVNSSSQNFPPAPPSSASHQSSSVAPPPPPSSRPQVRPDSSALPTAFASSPHGRSATQQQSPLHSSSSAANPTELPSSSSPHDGGEQQPETPRGESGISAFSERERSHLRNLSDPATVSTMDGTIAASSPPIGIQQRFPNHPRPVMEQGALASLNDRPQTIVSPPTAGEVEGDDYLSARGEVSPVLPRHDNERRSAFRESTEDLNR